MGRTVERYQNPAVGDQVNLRLFTYNSNNLSNLTSITQVDLYHSDPTAVAADNPNGLRLVQTIDGSVVTAEATGTYLLPVDLTEGLYLIGNYSDVWTVVVSDDQPTETINQYFQVYPSLWYTTPIPVVYDFQFHFQPNKFRRGSVQYVVVEIIPNVPTSGDLRRYYENLAIVSDLKISIDQTCGDCPSEGACGPLVDNVLVDYREKRYGYYKLDTTDMPCGLYDVWFQLDFGGNRYISDRNKLQIYD